MTPSSERTPPPYALKSVDKALELMEVLRDYGELRLVDAAAELGISASSAHRLLSMLVYRGFAVQENGRRYRPGPAMGQQPVGEFDTRSLRTRLQPHVEELAASTGYTTTVVIRVDSSARILIFKEGEILPLPGGRKGTILPINASATGRALLAELERKRVRKILRVPVRPVHEVSEMHFDRFMSELNRVRNAGFAINNHTTNGAVFSVGATIHNHGNVVAAIAVSLADPRSSTKIRHHLVESVLQTRSAVDSEFARQPLELV